MEKLFEETADHYEQKLNELFEEIVRLRKENTSLKGKNRGFRRTIRKLKQELSEFRRQGAEKQHYKNGRRGSRFNG